MNSVIVVKPGRCPPVRVVCPWSHPAVEAGSISLRPVVCLNDSECSGTDKCCYDRCLLYYTCKPAEWKWPFQTYRALCDSSL